MSKIVCIDAGHGGKDPGAVNGSRQEKTDVLNMALAKALTDTLTNQGIKVCWTRTTDIYEAPSAKATKGNGYKADLFVSLHRNSAASATANGVEVLVYDMQGAKISLASRVCQRFAELGHTNRGVKVRTDLTVLKNTSMPAILVETGFISNIKDNQLFDTHFDAAGLILAEEILTFLGIAIQAETPTQINTGWVKDGDRYYYYWSDGTIARNTWVQTDGVWYYLHADGRMASKEWIYSNGYWYFTNEDGSLFHGWLKYQSKWCYLDKNGIKEGVCVTGPYQVDGKWYYFDTDGYLMEDGAIVPDSSGALVVHQGVKFISDGSEGLELDSGK